MDTRHDEEWLGWELELTPHAADRAADRGFSMPALRAMLRGIVLIRRGATPGRRTATCTRGSRPWRLVLEPDPLRRVLVVVTAYPLRRRNP